MEIAVVAPSPKPFGIGGAEKLVVGLTDAINRYTKHEADLIKLPTDERSVPKIVESYYRFWKLNLDHFDMVISTKYPAWMVQHRNHVCYMLHRLRGVYDTYAGRTDLAGYFTELPTRFPGIYMRKIVHSFDDYALSKSRIKKFYCISKTVAGRRDYFPKGVEPTVIYPPSSLDHFENNGYEYIFTVSRLDHPKRIDLVIKAMKYVRPNIKLIIAGTGPQEEYLKDLAKDDRRIEFVGFASDDELIRLYSNALVVPYTPSQEDFGLITLEAMMSHKPVVTCNDSGGPTELVKDGENGFVVEPDPMKIAEKISYLIEHTSNAREMGDSAYRHVKDITWENAVKRIVDSNGR